MGSARVCRCGKPVSGHKRKRWCSAACRYQAWKEVHGSRVCAYCHAPADTIDHIPARAVRVHLVEHAPGKYPELEVRCCRECNALLGPRGFTFEARCQQLSQALRARYRDVLNAPLWSEAELSELGPTLQQEARQMLALKPWVEARLANIEG